MDAKILFNKIKDHNPKIIGHEEFSKYSILVPLVEKNEEIHVLFEIRSQELRRQPGEICFPGGKMEKVDRTIKDAALRETEEELRIDRGNITDVYPLDYLVTPFGMIVYPFAGFVRMPQHINPNPKEVEDIFTVPLSFFMETAPKIHHVHIHVQPEEDFPFDLIIGGRNYNWRTGKIDEYFYIYEDKVIWGLTARILSRFVELVR